MITTIYYLNHLHFLFGAFFWGNFFKNVLSLRQGIVTKKGSRKTYIPSLAFLCIIKKKGNFHFIAYFPLLERKMQKKGKRGSVDDRYNLHFDDVIIFINFLLFIISN
jgi:hypothetical protein